MMKRSQIYLPLAQWQRLNALSHQSHQSVSALIRKAIDLIYRKKDVISFEKALTQMAGLWKSRQDFIPTDQHIRNLRKTTRLDRLHKRQHG